MPKHGISEPLVIGGKTMGQALAQDKTAQDRDFVLELVGSCEATRAFFRCPRRVKHFLTYYGLAGCNPQNKGENEVFFQNYKACFAPWGI